jgi:hypothetical protein
MALTTPPANAVLVVERQHSVIEDLGRGATARGDRGPVGRFDAENCRHPAESAPCNMASPGFMRAYVSRVSYKGKSSSAAGDRSVSTPWKATGGLVRNRSANRFVLQLGGGNPPRR